MPKKPTIEQRSAAIDATILSLQIDIAAARALEAATFKKSDPAAPPVPGPCPYADDDPRVVELPAEIAEKQVGSLAVGGILRVMIGDDAYIRLQNKRQAMMLPDATSGRRFRAGASKGGKGNAALTEEEAREAVAEFKRLRAADPSESRSKTDLCRQVAEPYGVHFKTIDRAIKRQSKE